MYYNDEDSDQNYRILLHDILRQDELEQEYFDKLAEIKEQIIDDFIDAVKSLKISLDEIDYEFVEEGVSFAVNVYFKRNVETFPLALCFNLVKALSSRIWSNRRARVKINFNKSCIQLDNGVALHIAFKTTPEDFFSDDYKENECMSNSDEGNFVSLQKYFIDYDFQD